MKKTLIGVARFLRSNIVIVFILALIVLISFYSPGFLQFSSVRNLFIQISIYGIVACAMTIAIICGEFDLSVSYVFPLGTLIFALVLPHFGIIPAMIAAVIIGGLVGCVNGFLVAVLKVNVWIATLSTMIIVRGITLTICSGKPIPAINDISFLIGNGNLFRTIPYLALIFLAFVFVTEYILKRTTFGRNIFAVGGNYEVAAYAGINAVFYKFIIFVILGCTAAFSGALLAGRLQAGSPLYGNDLCMTVVSAAVIGGNSIAGGKGGALRTLLGMIFVGLMLQVFNFINVYIYLQEAIKGLMVILVVLMDAMGNKKSAGAVK
ncbi:ABC transporter permease [Treponema primitia]|uniref:ABC transporter permease n=1 Tax=Treponema primitia TaxID=88058 RepID=UPI0002554EAC|nr:ABC transporter permease [Treponema primitia]